jgi:hemerythrin-like domain-containing protein
VAGNHAEMTATAINFATPYDSAVAIIKQEHRSLGYLVHTLQRVLHDVGAHKADADFKLVATMLYYIDTFPDCCHHPKEDEYLFKRLRSRTTIANALLDQLQDQHVIFARMMAGLGQTFMHWQGGAPNGLQPFFQEVNAYAELLCGHMEQEEGPVLAIAREYLTADDWRAIDAAFRVNDDPLFGPHIRDEFARLRIRIINQLPRKIKHLPGQ